MRALADLASRGADCGSSPAPAAAGLALVLGVMHLVDLAPGSLFLLGVFVAALAERSIIRHLHERSHRGQVMVAFRPILFLAQLPRKARGRAPILPSRPRILSQAGNSGIAFTRSSCRIAEKADARCAPWRTG